MDGLYVAGSRLTSAGTLQASERAGRQKGRKKAGASRALNLGC